MKKLLGIVVLGLLLSGNAYAECVEGDCKNGFGTYVWPDGDRYVGEWKKGKEHGQGTLFYNWRSELVYGDKYEGEWKKGKQHGQGTYTWYNGNNYVGEWKNNKMHGKGTATSTDGRVKKGIWKNDELVKPDPI